MSGEARLDELRQRIQSVDHELIDLLARRLELAREIGLVKTRLGMQTLDPAREAAVVRRAAAAARERGLDPELVRDILWRLIAHARSVQDRDPPPAS